MITQKIAEVCLSLQTNSHFSRNRVTLGQASKSGEDLMTCSNCMGFGFM